MIIEGNAIERLAVKAGGPHSSPLSLILFGIYTSGLIKSDKQNFWANGLSFVDDLGWITTGKNLTPDFRTPKQ